MKLNIPEYPERLREKPKYELNPSSRAMVSFNSSPINIYLIYFNYIGLKVLKLQRNSVAVILINKILTCNFGFLKAHNISINRI